MLAPDKSYSWSRILPRVALSFVTCTSNLIGAGQLQTNCGCFFKIDEISPLEEALSTQVVHQLKDKGHPFSTSWGNGNSFLPMYSKDILIIALFPVIAIA